MGAGGAVGIMACAVDVAACGLFQHGADTGQPFGQIATGPRIRPLQGAGASGINLGHPDHQHGARVFAVAFEPGAQGRIGGQPRRAIDAQGGA